MWTVSDKTLIFCSVTFLRMSCRLWGNVGEYCTARHATHDSIIRRMRFACWIPKATDTFRTCRILTAFPRQLWSHARMSMLRYTHITALVFFEVVVRAKCLYLTCFKSKRSHGFRSGGHASRGHKPVLVVLRLQTFSKQGMAFFCRVNCCSVLLEKGVYSVITGQMFKSCVRMCFNICALGKRNGPSSCSCTCSTPHTTHQP